MQGCALDVTPHNSEAVGLFASVDYIVADTQVSRSSQTSDSESSQDLNNTGLRLAIVKERYKPYSCCKNPFVALPNFSQPLFQRVLSPAGSKTDSRLCQSTGRYWKLLQLFAPETTIRATTTTTRRYTDRAKRNQFVLGTGAHESRSIHFQQQQQ